MSRGDYQIGWGKPPRQSQFKPGQSGNPKGRPKGSKALKTLFNSAMDEKIEVTKGGRKRKLSRREVLVEQEVLKALRGDKTAVRHCLELLIRFDPEAAEQILNDELSADDAAILERALARKAAASS